MDATNRLSEKKINEYYDSPLPWDMKFTQSFLRKHVEGDVFDLDALPGTDLTRRKLQHAFGTDRGTLDFDLLSNAMSAGVTHMWVDPDQVFVPPSVQDKKFIESKMKDLSDSWWGLHGNMSWEFDVHDHEFYSNLTAPIDILMRNYRFATARGRAVKPRDVLPMIRRLASGELPPHPLRAHRTDSSEHRIRAEAVSYLQRFVAHGDNSANMQAIIKSKSRSQLFRLYACVVKIMLAFSELEGVRPTMALSRLSRAIGDLCLFYLSVTENAELTRRYAYALNAALNRAYRPVPVAVDAFAAKRYSTATSGQKPKRSAVRTGRKVTGAVANQQTRQSMLVLGHGHGETRRTQEENDAIYDPPSPLLDDEG